MVEPDKIDIRSARPEDGPALMDAVETINTETEFLGVPGERLGWADRATEELRNWQARNSAMYALAVEGGRIVGYLGAFAGGFARNRGVIWIGHVGLRQAWRGRGIGARLFAAAEDWARARGSWRLELRVDAQNAAALALYRKCGFVSEGTIPFAALYGEGWHTHHWMGKLLGPGLPSCAAIDTPSPSPPRAADTIVLRRLRVGDGPALWALEQALFTGGAIFLRDANEGPDLAATEKRIAGASTNPHVAEFVACLEGHDQPARIVGHAGIWVEPQFRMGHDGMLGVAVLPEYWGGGLGREAGGAGRGLGAREKTCGG